MVLLVAHPTIRFQLINSPIERNLLHDLTTLPPNVLQAYCLDGSSVFLDNLHIHTHKPDPVFGQQGLEESNYFALFNALLPFIDLVIFLPFRFEIYDKVLLG